MLIFKFFKKKNYPHDETLSLEQKKYLILKLTELDCYIYDEKYITTKVNLRILIPDIKILIHKLRSDAITKSEIIRLRKYYNNIWYIPIIRYIWIKNIKF